MAISPTPQGKEFLFFVSFGDEETAQPAVVGQHKRFRLGWDAQIVSYTMLGDVSGVAEIDLRSAPLNQYPPADAFSICRGFPAALRGERTREVPLPVWDVDLPAGNVLEFRVTKLDTITQVDLTVVCRRQ